MVLPACPCGSNDYKQLYETTYKRGIEGNYPFSLHQCRQCALVRSYPIPGVELYTSGYSHTTNAVQEYVSEYKSYIDLQADDFVRLTQSSTVDTSLPVLDVGCNGGELVAALVQRGMIAEGCDVDPVAVRHGQEQGLTLFVQDLCTAPLTKTYGKIALCHTLEHIVDLNIFLKHIASALPTGGLLYVRVPNYAGLIARAMKHNWGFLVPSLHVWEFTPHTLELCVNRASGLQLVNCSCRSTMEPTTSGVKGLVKKAVIKAGEMTNQSDEIVATFRKP